LIIATFAFLFGFAMIWHISWLAVVGLLGIIISVIIRTSDDDSEYVLKAAKIEKMEVERAHGKSLA